jgi:zinc protease
VQQSQSRRAGESGSAIRPLNCAMGSTIFVLLLMVWAPGARAMAIERVRSPAGIEAWLVEDHALPVVSIRFAFPGGAALDPVGKGGLGAMASSLLDEGAGPYDSAAFKTRLEDLVIDLRFEASRDEIGGSLRTLKPNLAQAGDLLRVALTSPRFEPGAIERVRDEFVASIAQQAQNPHALSNRLWMRDAFEDHPYGESVYGTAQSVAAITRDDLINFAAQRLHRAELVIAAVGDVTPGQLATLIDEIFGGLPVGAGKAEVAEVTPAETGGLMITRRQVPQSAVTFGQVGPKRDDPNWYAARLVNEILGGAGFRGRLMREIREKRGLAYGVSTELVSFRHAGLLLGSVATENARVAQSIALVRAEWRRMRDEGPTAADLDIAKAYLIGSFPLTLDTGARIASLLVEMQIEKLGIDYLDRRAALFDAVNLEKSREVAHRLLDPDGLSFAVVGDPTDLTPTRTAPDPRFQ